jgi:hypothetical protein
MIWQGGNATLIRERSILLLHESRFDFGAYAFPPVPTIINVFGCIAILWCTVFQVFHGGDITRLTRRILQVILKPADPSCVEDEVNYAENVKPQIAIKEEVNPSKSRKALKLPRS